MGITYVDGVVTGTNGQHESLRFLVDSGASYTLLPEATWRRLEIEPIRRMEFVLADGTAVEREVAEAFIELDAGAGHSPVILGEPGDDLPLLGAVTLENMGLVLDPFRRELRAMVARL